MSTSSRPTRSQTVIEWSAACERWVVSALRCHEWTLVGVFGRVQDAFAAADRAARRIEGPRPQGAAGTR